MRTLLLTLSCLGFAGLAAAQTRTVTLKDALADARLHSPILNGARAEFASILAIEKGAKAMAGPQASVNGFAKTGNNSSIISSAPKTDPSALMQVPPGNFQDGNVMLMVPILAGDLRAIAESARWQSKAAAGDFKEAQAELDLKVTEAYIKVQAAHEDVTSAQANLDSVSEMLRTTQARVEAGSAIEASVQRVMAEVRRSERNLARAKNGRAKALLDLKQVMGITLDTEITLDPTIASFPPAGDLPGSLDASKQQRGLLLSAKARTSAATFEVAAAKSLGQPRLYALGMGDVTNRRDMGGLTFGLTLSFPLYDGGRVRSEVAKTRAMKDKASAVMAEAELQVEKEVRQAMLDLETAQVSLASAEAEVVSAQSSYDVIKLRVEAGKAILLEQLDSLDLLSRTRADLVQARLDFALSKALLIRATGGSL